MPVQLNGMSAFFGRKVIAYNIKCIHSKNGLRTLHRTGLLQLDDVITEYLKLCIDYDNPPTNSKYCVQMMLRELQETPRGKQFLETQTLEDVW